MNHWLVKSEPSSYSFDDLLRDGSTFWSGVRNFQARNNLRLMKVGDQALFYHSNEGKEVVGIAAIVKSAYPDPTAKDGDWSVVDVKAGRKFTSPVTLETIKAQPKLKSLPLIKQSRLSVMPVTQQDFAFICKLGGL
jgi:predicted RNA-binding protein with PUA-like domain